MEPLSVRFEQKRGHFMLVERFPPVTRDELNETQLQMLKTCEIPGLLPLDTEECDGQLSLRYSLSGTRMLSEALRTTNWSMTEMMGALCRLAEVLEECRLYLLDADRIRLQDEFIFVGDEWHELKFTYIPIDMPTLRKADDLERLIIRWIMRVKEPDGQAMQDILRLVATAGFMPITLSRYARQYLAGSLKEMSLLSSHPPASVISTKPAASVAILAKTSRAWDLLGPPSGTLHSFSQMLGEDSAPPRHSRIPKPGVHPTVSDRDPIATSMDMGRWRIIVACIGLLLLALGWRFIYLEQPNQKAMLFCLCMTLVVGVGVWFLWNGLPDWVIRRYSAQTHPRGLRSEGEFEQPNIEYEETDSEGWEGSPRFAISLSPPNHSPMFMSNTSAAPRAPEEEDRSSLLPETSWISSPHPDQTALLNHRQTSPAEVCYLVWESKGASCRIPLRGESLVIGRSAEAAQHIDDTTGISRAHVEFVRISELWKVKDLGSRNGSLLNDKPMAPYQLYFLQEGDRLTLADSQYRFYHSI